MLFNIEIAGSDKDRIWLIFSVSLLMLLIDLDHLVPVTKARAVPSIAEFHILIFAAILPKALSILVVVLASLNEDFREVGIIVAGSLLLLGIFWTVADIGYWLLPGHIIVPAVTLMLLMINVGLWAVRRRTGPGPLDARAMEKFAQEMRTLVDTISSQEDPVEFRRRVWKMRRSCRRIRWRIARYKGANEFVAKYVSITQDLIDELKKVDKALARASLGSEMDLDGKIEFTAIRRELFLALQQYTYMLQTLFEEKLDEIESGNR